MTNYLVRFVRADGTRYAINIDAENKEQAFEIANSGSSVYGTPYKENGATVENISEPMNFSAYAPQRKIIGVWAHLPH